MVKHSFFCLPEFQHRGTVLALSFFLGHVLGVWFSGGVGESLFPLMRAVVSSRVTIVGLLSSVVLPFLISAFAVYLNQPILLIPTAFSKAFLFSYLGYGLCAAWGSAGWLITPLVMFSSLCSMPVLYWYWSRYLDGRRFEITVFFFVLGILALISAMGCYLIAPFLVNITYF